MSIPETDSDRARGRRYRGAGAAQRRDERRARLIDAAIQVFGTEGYRSATVDKLCATAGLTKRYFYESFTDSEALLLAAYARAIDDLIAGVVRGAESESGGESSNVRAMVHGGLTAYFTALADDPRLARITLVEILGVSPTVDRRYRQAIDSFVDTLIAMAGSAFAASPLPQQHHRPVATGLVGAVLMIAQQWLLAPHPQPIADVVDSAQAILTAVLGAQGQTGVG